jgi:hypothetical protein
MASSFFCLPPSVSGQYFSSGFQLECRMTSGIRWFQDKIVQPGFCRALLEESKKKFFEMLSANWWQGDMWLFLR